MRRTVKLQCLCGTRFAFEVEPVEGRMPVPVSCPACGADATEQANALLAQTADQPGDEVPPDRLVTRARLRLRRSAGAAAVAGTETPAGAAAEPERCLRHPTEPVVDHCRVCGRPICARCMEQHGSYCSVLCRGCAGQEGRSVPPHEGGRHVRAARRRQGLRWVGGLLVALVVVGIGHGFWWRFVGSKPRLVWHEGSAGEASAVWELVGSGDLLMLTGREAVFRQMPDGRIRWRLPLRGPEEEVPELVSGGLFPCWLQGQRLESVELETGRLRWQVTLPTPLTGVNWNDHALVAASVRPDGYATVVRVDLGSGSTWQQVIPPFPVVPGAFQQAAARGTGRSERVPTVADAGRMLAEEEAREALPLPPRRLLMVSGDGVLEFQSWLVERRVVEREGFGPRQGQSVLDDSGLRAGRSWGAVQEALNEIERIRTGGTIREDHSRYGVRLRRWGGSANREWTAEVVGPPMVIPLETVDVLWAGTTLIVMDRENRILWTAELAHPAPAHWEAAGRQVGTERPCGEIGGRLLVADQGTLTCFELATGRVRWRLPLMGIRRMAASPEGHALFLGATTATVEDLKHPLATKLWDRPRPLLLKVEAETGHVIWRQVGKADQCFLSGDGLYGWWLARGMSGEGTFFHFYRLDPEDGRVLWYQYSERWPRRMRFHDRRFLFQWEDGVEVREFRR